MATTGDAPIIEPWPSNMYTWWPAASHHHHATHVHALAYCQQCDAAYCIVCNRQWGGLSVTWTGTTGGTFSAGTTSNYQMHGGH